MVDLDADAHQYRLDEIEELRGRIESLEEEVSTARRTSNYWKMQHVEGNKRIETLSAALDECANQHRAIWSLAVKEQKGETTVSPYALAQITWAASENARAALAGEKKDDAR